MKKIKITVMRMACYKDLMEKYENPIQHACDFHEGQVFIADGWSKTISGLRKCPKLLSIQNEVRFGGAPIAVMCRAFDRLMSL
jgi:uncharacterized repeat protein (TIGR04076 family)